MVFVMISINNVFIYCLYLSTSKTFTIFLAAGKKGGGELSSVSGAPPALENLKFQGNSSLLFVVCVHIILKHTLFQYYERFL